MRESGDLVIGRSGDLQDELTAETRRRGERSEDRDTGTSGNREIGREADSYHEVKISHAAGICHPERVGADATPSRRTPTKIVPELAASGSSYETTNLTAEARSRGEDQELTTEARRHGERSGDLVVKIMQTLKAMLREIFDESAYDRFLLRTHASRSVASYRSFISERDAAMMKKPRCC